MGKIMVTGAAEKEFLADECVIDIDVQSKERTAAKAAGVVTKECEKFLSELSKIGMPSDHIQLKTDTVKSEGYRESDNFYTSTKRLAIELPADMIIINGIRRIIENGFDTVSMSIKWKYSKENEAFKEVMDMAILDSKAKAERLADTMGCRIVGIDSANLSGYDDVRNLAVLEEDWSQRYGAGDFLGLSLSDLELSNTLTPDKITVESSVKIIWKMC